MRNSSYISQRLAQTAQDTRVQYERALDWLKDFSSAVIFPEEFLDYSRFWIVEITSSSRQQKLLVRSHLCHAKRYGIALPVTTKKNGYNRDDVEFVHRDRDIVAAENQGLSMKLPAKGGVATSSGYGSGQNIWWTHASRPPLPPTTYWFYLPQFKLPKPIYWSVSTKGTEYDELHAVFGDKADAAKYAHQLLERVL